jgi:nucleoside recognition membrane protein YjiH
MAWQSIVIQRKHDIRAVRNRTLREVPLYVGSAVGSGAISVIAQGYYQEAVEQASMGWTTVLPSLGAFLVSGGAACYSLYKVFDTVRDGYSEMSTIHENAMAAGEALKRPTEET